jgi:hypothetical protein
MERYTHLKARAWNILSFSLYKINSSPQIFSSLQHLPVLHRVSQPSMSSHQSIQASDVYNPAPSWHTSSPMWDCVGALRFHCFVLRPISCCILPASSTWPNILKVPVLDGVFSLQMPEPDAEPGRKQRRPYKKFNPEVTFHRDEHGFGEGCEVLILFLMGVAAVIPRPPARNSHGEEKPCSEMVLYSEQRPTESRPSLCPCPPR